MQFPLTFPGSFQRIQVALVFFVLILVPFLSSGSSRLFLRGPEQPLSCVWVQVCSCAAILASSLFFLCETVKGASQAVSLLPCPSCELAQQLTLRDAKATQGSVAGERRAALSPTLVHRHLGLQNSPKFS